MIRGHFVLYIHVGDTSRVVVREQLRNRAIKDLAEAMSIGNISGSIVEVHMAERILFLDESGTYLVKDRYTDFDRLPMPLHPMNFALRARPR